MNGTYGRSAGNQEGIQHNLVDVKMDKENSLLNGKFIFKTLPDGSLKKNKVI